MGYALIMFVTLLIMSAVIITVVNYGVEKDSQSAPLKAENTYAEREAGKVQSGITIISTCIEETDRYTTAQGSVSLSGPHTLNLGVKNNGSTVLNSTKVTVLYNTSYVGYTVKSYKEEKDALFGEACKDENQDDNMVWAPLSYVCIQVENIFIPTPNSPAPGPELRLLVAAENGVYTIAPTSPANFTGRRDGYNTTFLFNWNASYDEDGIALYRLYALDSAPDGRCPIRDGRGYLFEIPGNQSSSQYDYSVACGSQGKPPCNNDWYFLTAVDALQNEGIPSRTLKCAPSPDAVCSY